MRPDHLPPTHISTFLGTPCLRGFLRSSPLHRPQGFPSISSRASLGDPSLGTPSLGTPLPPGPTLSLPSPRMGLRRGQAHTNTTATMSSDTTASAAKRPASTGRERGPHPEQEPGGWGPRQEGG